jgi:prepilin-type N-terminal cleavage/methylation domain-containing protein
MTRSTKAFTLIELITVVVVVGTLGVIAIPNVNKMSEIRRASTIRTLQRDVSYARERALATGTVMWVCFDKSNNLYELRQGSTASPGPSGATVITDPATQRAWRVNLNQNDWLGISLSSISFPDPANGSATSSVGFDRLGRPIVVTSSIMTSDGTVSFTSGYQVRVAGNTGLVTYETFP